VISRQTLYGRDRTATATGLLLAGVLFVAFYLFWRLPGVSAAAYDLLPVDVIGGGIAGLLTVAALQAHYNDGIVVIWVLVFLPVLGATMNFVGVGLQSPTLWERLALIVAIPAVAALLIGTGGYLLGSGSRYVVRSAGTD